MPLTGLAPGSRVVKPIRFFATRHAQKLQGLSNQYPHLKLFSIFMGRNKPESQSTAPTADSYIHCLWPGVLAPSQALHLQASLS